MASQTMFLDCPAYLDKDCAARCGLPAEVEVRSTMASTDGPMESAKIRCPRGHWFNGLIESITAPEQQAVAVVSASLLRPQTIQSRTTPNARSASPPLTPT